VALYRDKTVRKKQQDHIEYLYQVLLAIRNVNQLIVVEKNRDVLLQRICDLMVETKGYNHCRIIYTDDSGKVKQVYDTSSVKNEPHIGDNVDRYPCSEKLVRDKVTVIDNPQETCGKCSFYSGTSGYSVLVMPLSHIGKSYGLFTVAVPVDMTAPYELSLFKEIVGDISFALYSLDVEEDRACIVEALRESEARYRSLVEDSSVAISVTVDGEIVYASPERLKLTGHASKEDLIGVSGVDSVVSEDKAGIRERLESRMRGEEVSSVHHFKLRTNNGGVIHVVDYMSDIMWEGKAAVMHILQDITEQKRLEEAVKERNLEITESKEKLEALHNSALNYYMADTPEKIAEHTLDTVDKILGFTHASYSVVEDDTRRIIATKGTEMSLSLVLPFDAGEVVVRAFKTGETQIVPDTRLDLDYLNYLGEMLLSELAVPIKIDGKVVGVINVESEDLDAFTERDSMLIEILANHAAAAIQRMQRTQERVEYQEKLRALHLNAQQLSAVTSLQEVYDVTLETMESTLGLLGASVLMVEGDVLRQVARSKWMPSEVELPLDGGGITVKVVREGKSVIVPDVTKSKDYLYARDISGSTGMGERVDFLSELAVPIILNDKVIGVLNVESLQLDAFTELGQKLVEVLSEHVASAITRLRQSEEKIELEKHVLVQQVQVEMAQELDDLKTQFISTATHELRTPVTSILGYLELVIADNSQDLPETVKNDLNVVHRNANRLATLTDDLLDVQRITSGRFEIHQVQVDLVSTLNEIVEELTPMFAEKQHVLQVNAPAELIVDADEIRISQLFINLLRNANKFTPAEGDIAVSVESLESHVQISVKDSGIGLSKEDMEKLFKPFPGIHHGLQVSSSGLGLAICKGIVDMHNGEIWVESEGHGKGSTFTFTIPNSSE